MTSGDPDDPTDAPELVALTELGRDAVKPHTAAELHRGLDAVRARLTAGHAHRRAMRRGALLVTTVAVCSLVAVTVTSMIDHRLAPEPPVAVSRIEGGSLREGGYLSQSGAAGVKVLFSEGTTFELMPGTRGRLRSVASDGAHLAVEHGTASFGVTQSRAHRWLVEAGPFLVTVKGTVFTVSWDPSSERFELRLRHGRVVVSGPVVNGSIALQAGQRLVVNLPRAETVITEDQAAGDAPGAHADAAERVVAGPATIASVSSPTRASSAPSSPPAKGARSRRWAADLASGISAVARIVSSGRAGAR